MRTIILAVVIIMVAAAYSVAGFSGLAHTAGDVIYPMIMNQTDSDDPTMISGSFWIEHVIEY